MTGPALRDLVVRGPFHGTGGHDHHVREFVRHLAAIGVRVQLLDLPEWGSPALPPDRRDPWFDTLGAPVDSDTALHFCMPHQVRAAAGLRLVNYTMFEASRIPVRWAVASARHDLVVLPTESSWQAWQAAGIAAERLRLCPLGVDGERFRPGLAPLPLLDRAGRPVTAYATRVLNVSELNPRKNLAGLLRVWLSATRPDDDAILIIKLTQRSEGSVMRLMREVNRFEQASGRSWQRAAPVLFVERRLADAEMPNLFAVATHYWSMSHGEGWDQPMMEAAASGLRLIAPRHSAYTAYLDDEVAAMIPACAAPAIFEGDDPLAALFRGAHWWDPDEEAACRLLRQALEGTDRPRQPARDRIVSRFTWEQAARQLLAILDEAGAAHPPGLGRP